ncbi:hypothetical protein [Gilliamella sp. CG25]
MIILYQRPNIGERTGFGLENYPQISFADSRSILHEFRSLLAKGIELQV